MVRPAEVMEYDELRPLIIDLITNDTSKFGISTHDIATTLVIRQTIPSSQFEAFKKDVESVIRSLSAHKVILGGQYVDVQDNKTRKYFKMNPDYREDAPPDEEKEEAQVVVAQPKSGSRVQVIGLVEIPERESHRRANSVSVYFSPLVLGDCVVAIAIQHEGHKWPLPYIRGTHEVSITDCPDDLDADDNVYEAEVLFLTIDAGAIPQQIGNMLDEDLQKQIMTEQLRKTNNKLGLEIAIPLNKGEVVVLSVTQMRSSNI